MRHLFGESLSAVAAAWIDQIMRPMPMTSPTPTPTKNGQTKKCDMPLFSFCPSSGYANPSMSEVDI